MTRWVVTLLGALAWAAALALIARGRATRRLPPERSADLTTGARLAAVAARVTGSMAGAMVAGVLVLGLGGRLLMRVMAATSPDSAQGRVTDADEIVGEVTVDGTLGLVIFVGVLGGLVGLALFALLRRWLPQRSVVAGLVTAGIGAGLVARPTGLLDPHNRDFAILSPTWLAVALALGLILTYALLAAVLIDRWAASWPRPRLSVRGVIGLLPLVPLALAGPTVVVAVAAIALVTVLGHTVGQRAWVGPVDRVLRVAVVAGAVAGTAWLLAAAGEILTA